MAGKLRQGREIDLRRLFQPRLICFPVGVQYADSAETRRLGGFQGVEGILEYQRFCRGRPQRFRRQMVDHRLMLADAHLAGGENCFQVGQQAQPIQRSRAPAGWR